MHHGSSRVSMQAWMVRPVLYNFAITQTRRCCKATNCIIQRGSIESQNSQHSSTSKVVDDVRLLDGNDFFVRSTRTSWHRTVVIMLCQIGKKAGGGASASEAAHCPDLSANCNPCDPRAAAFYCLALHSKNRPCLMIKCMSVPRTICTTLPTFVQAVFLFELTPPLHRPSSNQTFDQCHKVPDTSMASCIQRYSPSHCPMPSVADLTVVSRHGSFPKQGDPI